MKSTLFSVDALAGQTRTMAADEIANDYYCSTVLAMTEVDTGLLAVAILRIQTGEALSIEQRAFLDRLGNALGSRRCEGNNIQELDHLK